MIYLTKMEKWERKPSGTGGARAKVQPLYFVVCMWFDWEGVQSWLQLKVARDLWVHVFQNRSRWFLEWLFHLVTLWFVGILPKEPYFLLVRNHNYFYENADPNVVRGISDADADDWWLWWCDGDFPLSKIDWVSTPSKMLLIDMFGIHVSLWQISLLIIQQQYQV